MGLLETEIPVARVTPAVRVVLAQRERLVLLVRAGTLEPLETPVAQVLRVTPALRELLVQGLLRAPRAIPEGLVLQATQGRPAPQARLPRPSP